MRISNLDSILVCEEKERRCAIQLKFQYQPLVPNCAPDEGLQWQGKTMIHVIIILILAEANGKCNEGVPTLKFRAIDETALYKC